MSLMCNCSNFLEEQGWGSFGVGVVYFEEHGYFVS